MCLSMCAVFSRVKMCAIYSSINSTIGRGHHTLGPMEQERFRAASRALESPWPMGHSPFRKMSLYRPTGTALYGKAVGPRKCRNRR